MLSLGGDNASAEKFDKDDTDSLDNWARRRGEAMAMANVSAAKSAYNTYSSVGPGGMWGYNPYFGIYTYIPGTGRLCDPYYGYCYWSPGYVNRLYYNPPPTYVGNGGGFGGGAYPGMGATSSGYSGTIASSSGMSSSPAASSSMGSSAASSAGSSSVGHGSAGGGGGGGGSVGGGGGRGH
jgi:hypothetical protein